MDIYKPHDKLQSCISHMISGEVLPYYGEFNLFVNFIKDSTVKTCGVNLTDSGMNFYWNEEFLDYLPQPQVNFVLIHETFHLLFDHPERSEGYQKDISNIAQDMIINQIIKDDILRTDKPLIKGFVEIPVYGDKKMAIFPPYEYKGNLIFEELYWWLIKEMEKEKSGKEISKELSDIFKEIEKNDGMFLDKHIDDNVSQEYRRQVIENIKDKLNGRGLITNDISSTLNKLKKQNKDYLKFVKRSIVNQLFGNIKYSSILRPNRRGLEGLKGKKKLGKSINCILDTSGSMKKTIEYVLSFIFQNNIEINLIQIDAEVKKFDVIRNMNQLQKMDIKGGGGSTLTPSIKYIVNNKKLNKLNSVILTDGMVDTLDFKGIKNKTLIITTVKFPKLKNHNKVKTIKVPKKIF